MKKGEAGVVVAQFFGWLLMGVGGLIAVTSGACSVFVFITTLSDTSYIGGNLMMILLFGGIPFAVGAVVFVFGRFLARMGETKQRPPRRVQLEDDGSPL